MFFSAFRVLGLDIFLAGEAAAAVFRVIGFASITVLGFRFLRLPYPAVLLVAVLATVCDAMYVQSLHVQLLSVALAPLLAIMLCQTARNFGRVWHCVVWSCLAAALFDAWLLTAFYTAWFTVLFALLSAVAAGPRQLAAVLRKLPLPALAPAAVVLAAGALPFALVYAPKARETGMHPYADALAYTPSVLDLIHVGPGNLLFGWLDRWLTAVVRPGFPPLGEHTVGLPPPLLVLAVAGAILGIARAERWRPFAIAFLVSLVLCVHAGRFSLWWLVYEAVPGARAVRVVSRFMLFLYPIAALFAAWLLAGAAQRKWRWAAVALAVLLVAEEATSDGSFTLNRPQELHFARDVPPPPPECEAFYVQVPRQKYLEAASYIPLVVNVDGMVLAELLHLPTLNGHGSFLPAGFSVGFSDPASYLAAVRMSLLSSGGMHGVCGLDLQLDTWTKPNLPIVPVALNRDILFSWGGEGADILLRGWNAQEPTGRWSEGPDAQFLMRVDDPSGGLTLTVEAWAFAGRSPPGLVEVFANGSPVARWQPTGPLELFTASIPARLIPGSGVLQLRFAITRPMSPYDAGQSNDRRMLGLFVRKLRLSPSIPAAD